MNKTLLLLIIIFFWFLPPAQAEIKTFVHTVRQPFSGSQSPDDARVAAIHKAKREVLEKSGTYLETLAIVEDGRLTKDQILALAGGVLKTEIISQKHYHTEEGFGIIIKARVEVDTGVLEDRVKQLIADGTAMEQLADIHKREKRLLDRIERLEEANRTLTKQKETQTVKKKKQELKKEFQQTTKGLDAVALAVQAMELFEEGKFTNPRRALELLDKAIELDPGFAMAYNNRGSAYAILKQYDIAIQDFDKAIELNPGLAMPYKNRGSSYDDLKQYGRAIQDFDKAIELNPGYVTAYNNRGVAYAKLKQLDRAIQDYNKAIELDPGFANAYYGRGIAYIVLGKVSKGCADVKKACELGFCMGLRILNKRGYCL